MPSVYDFECISNKLELLAYIILAHALDTFNEFKPKTYHSYNR